MAISWWLLVSFSDASLMVINIATHTHAFTTRLFALLSMQKIHQKGVHPGALRWAQTAPDVAMRAVLPLPLKRGRRHQGVSPFIYIYIFIYIYLYIYIYTYIYIYIYIYIYSKCLGFAPNRNDNGQRIVIIININIIIIIKLNVDIYIYSANTFCWSCPIKCKVYKGVGF